MGFAPVVYSFHQHPVAERPAAQAMDIERHGHAAASGPCLACRAAHQQAQLPIEPAGPARGLEPSGVLLHERDVPPLDPLRGAVFARAPPTTSLSPI